MAQTKQLLMPEMVLPMSEIKLQTAYDLLRQLPQFSCANPGVFGTTSTLVQLPPVGDIQSPYHVPTPSSSWSALQLPLNAPSLQGIQAGEAHDYAKDVYIIYYLVNLATSLARSFDGDGGSHCPV